MEDFLSLLSAGLDFEEAVLSNAIGVGDGGGLVLDVSVAGTNNSSAEIE